MDSPENSEGKEKKKNKLCFEGGWARGATQPSAALAAAAHVPAGGLCLAGCAASRAQASTCRAGDASSEPGTRLVLPA